MNEKTECVHLLASLSEYVDGTLDESLCAKIEAHIAECEDCRVVVDTLRKMIYIVRSERKTAECVPEDVKTRLYKRLSLERFLNVSSESEKEGKNM